MSLRLQFSIILSAIIVLWAQIAAALTADNLTAGAINAGTSCAGGGTFTRIITIPGSFTVTDLDVGFLATHTWRGDIRLDLTSPAGTTVRLINTNTGGGGNIDNYNVRLDDSAGNLINTVPHNTPDGTVAPPYENVVRPNNALSAFNGEDAQGDWTLSICDNFPGADNGNLVRSTLFFDLTPTPPPPLPCSAAEQISHIWDLPGGTNGWTAGSLVNGYTADTIPLSFAFTGNTENFIPRGGIATPVTTAEFTGGGTQNGLVGYADFPSSANSITLTINLGTASEGVQAVTASVYDIDRNTWADRITVTGTLDGVAVTPVLSSSEFNMVDGSSIVGTAQAPSASGDGNGTLTFTSPVDQIVLVYDNHPSIGANPGAQVMALAVNMIMCPPVAADLTAVKFVEVFDPGNLGLYMTPGNEILYTISVNNSAAATAAANNITISDTLPDNLTFVSATTTGFTGGTFGSPALPTANTDCTGGNCVISFAGGSLPEDTTGEIVVRAVIQ